MFCRAPLFLEDTMLQSNCPELEPVSAVGPQLKNFLCPMWASPMKGVLLL
jgi:hypothetical protein